MSEKPKDLNEKLRAAQEEAKKEPALDQVLRDLADAGLLTPDAIKKAETNMESIESGKKTTRIIQLDFEGPNADIAHLGGSRVVHDPKVVKKTPTKFQKPSSSHSRHTDDQKKRSR